MHNEDGGLPADATQQLVDLGKANRQVSLGQLSYPELFAIVMALPVLQLEDLFGSVPTQRTMAQLDYDALRPVVTLIQKLDPDDDPPLSAPSPSKLKANDLSSTMRQSCYVWGVVASRWSRGFSTTGQIQASGKRLPKGSANGIRL